MNYLSVCAIVKNEAPYIEEWVAFHLLQGVEHFYIYDNESTDGTVGKLVNFPDKITIIPWDKHPGQKSAYDHAIHSFRNSTEWMAFIDADEFLYSTRFLTVSEILNRREFNDVGAVTAHWLLYGSNGHDTKIDDLVIERFVRRQADVNPHVKSIVRMKHAVAPYGPHAFKTLRRAVNEKGLELPDDYSLEHVNPTADLLRINHYHTKSREEALERWMLPRADNGGNRLENFDEHFAAHDRNEVIDTSACMRSGKIKEILKYDNDDIKFNPNPEIKLVGGVNPTNWFFRFVNETQQFEWNPDLVKAFVIALEKQVRDTILKDLTEERIAEQARTNEYLKCMLKGKT